MEDINEKPIISITVKDVGQGDCIIIEWDNIKGKKCLGIIDCHEGNNNSTKLFQYVVKKYKSIEFIILTHPHTDHFSGLLSFLKMCKKSKIIVNEFYYSCSSTKENITTSKILQKSLPSDVYLNRMMSLLKYVKLEYKNKGHIKGLNIISAESSIILSPELTLELLSPTYDEINKFIEKEFSLEEKSSARTRTANNPEANRLSIMSVLRFQNRAIALFTSDCLSETFDRILEKDKTGILNDNPLFLQVPHHGSKKNHNTEFWDRFSLKNSISFISVGFGYNHPSLDIVEYFNTNSKMLYSTNNVGGWKSFWSKSELKNADLNNNSLINFISVDDNDNQSFTIDRGDIRVSISKSHCEVLETGCII